MRQHPINLMPEEIRLRSLAGLRAGQFITCSILAILAMIGAATYVSLSLSQAQRYLFQASSGAAKVFEAEAEAARLRGVLKDTTAFIEQYERIAHPLSISAVLATVVNELPDSVTLDQIDVDAGPRTIAHSSRSKGAEDKDASPPRLLTAEISGFAASDQHIAELVSRLSALPPFREVSLDFSRTRDVRGHNAREFRLSFSIDLERRYEVASRQPGREGSTAALGGTGVLEGNESDQDASSARPVENSTAEVNDVD